MTEEIPATPGWVDAKLDEILAGLDVGPARDEYQACLAARKEPAAPSDMLGAEFEGCRPTLRRALLQSGMDETGLARIDAALEALEAEIAGQS